MVIAVLANRFAPSSRGLKRAERKPNFAADRRPHQLGRLGRRRRDDDDVNDVNEYHDHLQNDEPRTDGILKNEHPWRQRAFATGHRRKPFRAMACLTSLASDLDLIADWVFYRETLKNDREYRAECQASGTDASSSEQVLPYLIPPILLRLVLISCILGTIMWVILATDGRIAAPVLRRLGFDSLSMGFILFVSVCVEDIPQVVLTFLIEDYYEEEYLSAFAVCNVLASLYDTLIKIAEAIDERNDRVETGAWCKHSIEAAHSESITAIVTLLPATATSISTAHALDTPSDHPSPRRAPGLLPRLLQPNRLGNNQRKTSISSTNTTPWPCLRFLTSSLDGTIGLWDSRLRPTEVSESTTAASIRHPMALPTLGDASLATGTVGTPEVVRVRSYPSHQAGVSCLALLGRDNDGSLQSYHSHSDSAYFVSGSDNGVARLWHIDTGECRCEYPVANSSAPATNSPISSIAVVQAGSVFVAGYQDGTARLWHAWTGSCLAICRGHSGTIRSVTSMGESTTFTFVSASIDRTLRLWQIDLPTTTALAVPSSDASCDASLASLSSDALFNANDTFAVAASTRPLEMNTCHEIYQGHTDAVLCVACMECGTMFVSGSMDRTARLWSAETGACLQLFAGHSAGVSAVAAVDEVTLLTGSYDTSVKVWDALRGTCLRTYTGHSAVVTGISVTDDDTTFVTSSADRTVKLWVLTALPADLQTPKVFDQVMEINDGLCRGIDPD